LEKVPIKKIAVFVSGKASTLDNICSKLDVEVTWVISNNLKAMSVVEKHKLKLIKVLDPLDPNIYNLPVDLIVLAGWNKLVPAEALVNKRIINIHPSLLPKYGGKGYYGLKVHEAVLTAKERISGCTVHWVDEQYDHGKIIAQQTVPVFDYDTPESLQERVQEAERELYPQTIKNCLQYPEVYHPGEIK
jgi:phosphoribosylglycinamide formyltransferase-1